jgi:hypothetical protein
MSAPSPVELLLDALGILFNQQLRVPGSCMSVAGELAAGRLRLACELVESALASEVPYLWQAKACLASMKRANLSPANLFVVSDGVPQLLVAVRRLHAANMLRLLTVLSESDVREQAHFLSECQCAVVAASFVIELV